MNPEDEAATRAIIRQIVAEENQPIKSKLDSLERMLTSIQAEITTVLTLAVGRATLDGRNGDRRV